MISFAAAAALIVLLGLHVGTAALAAWRCKARTAPMATPPQAPPVTLIRPVCGLEHGLERTLGSSLQLNYPDYELIFCVARPDDPAVPLVRRLMHAHPQIRTQLLIGEEPISTNPKLNNLVKGWRAARTDWIVMADSNVDMPADYIQRLLAAWQKDTGMVCSPAIGGCPASFAAELECAFLNTFQARWQYAADSLGFGFAHGKSMLVRRELLDRVGGIEALRADIAEDAAATKLVRAAGLRVRLVDPPFFQPLGPRSLGTVWNRQVRWARLRRASFAPHFVAELLASGVVPVALAAIMALGYGVPLAVVPATGAVWYGTEAVLAHMARWPLTMRSPLAFIVRDLLLPVIWIRGWIDTRFVWRGHLMSVAPRGT